MALYACNTATGPDGRELARHGTALFPIACYHDDLTSEPVPWHWHEELEAGIVTEGRVRVMAGTESFLLSEGDGFFINSGVLHSVWNLDTVPCRLHSLAFHPRLTGGSADSIFWQKYTAPLLGDTSLKGTAFLGMKDHDREALTFIEKAWQSAVAEPEGFELSVRDSLSRLLFLLLEKRPLVSPALSEKDLRDAARIKTMLAYIQNHYQEELTADTIAKSASISTSECLRCFKSAIHTTPIQYVKQFRIQKAAELLSSTDRKIVEIGSLCGFQDMSYFSKTFREVKGLTPSRYRDRLNL